MSRRTLAGGLRPLIDDGGVPGRLLPDDAAQRSDSARPVNACSSQRESLGCVHQRWTVAPPGTQATPSVYAATAPEAPSVPAGSVRVTAGVETKEPHTHGPRPRSWPAADLRRCYVDARWSSVLCSARAGCYTCVSTRVLRVPAEWDEASGQGVRASRSGRCCRSARRCRGRRTWPS